MERARAMGSIESSEEGALTPVCCVPRSNSPNFSLSLLIYKMAVGAVDL